MTVVYGIREIRKGTGVAVWGLKLPDGRVVMWDARRERVEAWSWQLTEAMRR